MADSRSRGSEGKGKLTGWQICAIQRVIANVDHWREIKLWIQNASKGWISILLAHLGTYLHLPLLADQTDHIQLGQFHVQLRLASPKANLRLHPAHLCL